MPLSLENLHGLYSFYFDSTVCEPNDPAFKAWFSGITNTSKAALCPVRLNLPLLVQ